MQVFGIGKQYPLPIKPIVRPDSTIIELDKEGPIYMIFYTGQPSKEENAIWARGDIRTYWYIDQQEHIQIMAMVFAHKTIGPFELDAPFIVPDMDHEEVKHWMESESNIINFHLVDFSTNTLRGSRQVSIQKEDMDMIKKSIMEGAEFNKKNKGTYDARLNKIYKAHNIRSLIKNGNVH